MNHTVGVICQYGTAHNPDSCPCGKEHGYMQIECPTASECQQAAHDCSVCNPDDVDAPPLRLSTDAMTAALPPGSHAHSSDEDE